MLQIRNEQMRILDQSVLEREASALADDLSASEPALVRGLSWSQVMVRSLEALYTGRGYGLSARADLRGFAVLTFLLGPDFHRNPAIAAYLLETPVEASIICSCADGAANWCGVTQRPGYTMPSHDGVGAGAACLVTLVAHGIGPEGAHQAAEILDAADAFQLGAGFGEADIEL
jgi:hypothetical protein